MYFDKENSFSWAQSLILGLGASAVSTNSIDIGLLGLSPGHGGYTDKGLVGGALALPLPQGPNGPVGGVIHDVARGFEVPIACQVITTVVGAGASVEFQIIQATDAALTAGIDVLATTGAKGVALLVQGFIANFRLPIRDITKRFLGLRYVDSGAATTAGAVSAGVVPNLQNSY